MINIVKRDSPLRGQSLFIFTVLVVGLSGLIAQVLLLRELMVSFLGNELTLGVILANWVIAEAAGIFSAGKLIEKVKNKINTFLITEALFFLTFPLSIYLCRIFKVLIGINFGEAVGLSTIFFASFFIILPVAFLHGVLFNALCKIYASSVKETDAAIGKVYAWEIIGTITGGLGLTYILLSRFNSFQIVFLVIIINLVACFSLLKDKLKYLILVGIVLAVYLFAAGLPDYLQRASLNKQWAKAEVLDYRNSIYGNIVATKEKEQYTFFYNGLPVITTPRPDITFVEEFGNLPLLFHREPRDIAIIGAGAGGLINEVLKHSIRKLDYVELDPALISVLKKYPTDLTRHELGDKRVNVVNLDGRLFLRSSRNKYDIILVGLSKPMDLSVNRLFTQEFFALARDRLNKGGILAFWIPGSLTYLSQEIKYLNSSILNGLKNIHAYVWIIPGDYNIFLASMSKDILQVSPQMISQRINQENIKTNLLLPDYLNYRLDKKWVDWFMGSIHDAAPKINKDFAPIAVFQMLVYWNKQFSLPVGNFLAAFQQLNLWVIMILVGVLTLFLFFIFRRKPKLRIAYSIATTGFFGMLASLVLIFSFQVFYGYLYYKIGLLVSVFMAGIAFGSIFITRKLKQIKGDLGLFMKLEILILLFAFLLPWLITKLIGWHMFFFFVSGFLMGVEFPLAGKIYLGNKNDISATVGALYGADLIGGWFAGILGGIVFLPILGLFNTCMVMVLLKLSSLLLLAVTEKGFTRVKI